MPNEVTSNLKKSKMIAKEGHKAHMANKNRILHLFFSKISHISNDLHELRCLLQSSIVNQLNDLYLNAVPVSLQSLLEKRLSTL